MLILSIVLITIFSMVIFSKLNLIGNGVSVFLGLLLGCGFLYYHNIQLGYPVETKFEEKFKLISFHESEKSDKIYLWVKIDGETKPKSFEIDATPEMKERLKEAGKYLKKNVQVEGTAQRGSSFSNKMEWTFKPIFEFESNPDKNVD